MLHEVTNWPRVYLVAAVVGAAFGLLFALGALPAAPRLAATHDPEPTRRVAAVVLLVAAGVLVGLVLAATAHLGVRLQLRRRSKEGMG
jgi:hypothetical protein